MNRKIIGFALCTLLFALCLSAEAQQPKKIPRIGFLSGSGNPTRTAPDPNAEAFRQGLRDLGYIEGKNILVEYRYAEGNWTVSQALWPNSCNSRSMSLSQRNFSSDPRSQAGDEDDSHCHGDDSGSSRDWVSR